MNRFGNLYKADNQILSTSTPHPDDKKDGFFKMQFITAPKICSKPSVISLVS